MRKKIVAGNWKMNLTMDESSSLVNEVLNLIEDDSQVEVVFAVPSVYLYEINKICHKFKNVNTASQNISIHDEGPFTGEISAKMINSLNVRYSVLGHSERREHFKETNKLLIDKVNLSVKNDLEIIFCCGESLQQRKNNEYFEWIKCQISESLFHLSEKEFEKVIIAYEPIWAIGTGMTASVDQAEEVHTFIRKIISDKYGHNIAKSTSILYGGSCNQSNAKELFSKENIDGGLIGGASLNAESFMGIIKSF